MALCGRALAAELTTWIWSSVLRGGRREPILKAFVCPAHACLLTWTCSVHSSSSPTSFSMCVYICMQRLGVDIWSSQSFSPCTLRCVSFIASGTRQLARMAAVRLQRWSCLLLSISVRAGAPALDFWCASWGLYSRHLWRWVIFHPLSFLISLLLICWLVMPLFLVADLYCHLSNVCSEYSLFSPGTSTAFTVLAGNEA